MFKPGDEVVCIKVHDGEPHPFLAVGRVYVVTAFYPETETCWDGVRLAGDEQAWQSSRVPGDTGWTADQFRKVQKRSTETGMAILKKIADKPNIKIKEDV